MAENLLANSFPPSVSAFSLHEYVSHLCPPAKVVLEIVMAEHREHLWMICCVFISKKNTFFVEFLS